MKPYCVHLGQTEHCRRASEPERQRYQFPPILR